ncbi:hypothetical protein BbuMM1_A170 (plasmid) [Borreliella burgdorferi]|nr:hypothetical protein BbuMM1_A170 [Borreliella burgdorferi]
MNLYIFQFVTSGKSLLGGFFSFKKRENTIIHKSSYLGP